MVTGTAIKDPIVNGVAGGILLWLIGIWAGWQLRRHHLALRALLPGGVVLALVLDYTRKDSELAIIYLTSLLVLISLTHYKKISSQWFQKGVDYAESIVIDSALVAIPVIIFLVAVAILQSIA